MTKEDSWNDCPTEEDRLGFEDYPKSIVKVIREADTPITIDIFGTWGSGKISLMRMVRKDPKAGNAGAPPAMGIHPHAVRIFASY